QLRGEIKERWGKLTDGRASVVAASYRIGSDPPAGWQSRVAQQRGRASLCTGDEPPVSAGALPESS
ncbi:MAG: hypothetical protein R6X31_05675, partial [Anaerolineae bacterium]